MLSIRPEQMAAFARYAEQQFKDRLEVHLTSFLRNKGIQIGGDDLREQIGRGLKLCPEFGLNLQSDIARFFEIVCGSAGGFTTQPLPKEAQNILYGYRVAPTLKLDRLRDWAEQRRVEGQ